MVAMLAAGSSALFTSVALLTKHDHWQLEAAESKALAEALNDAINTLPTKYYAAITKVIEQWIPWVNLAFCVGAIVVPRIEESTKRIEASHYRPREAGNARDGGTEANPFDHITSLGGNP
jgi:hypothetical protein